MNRYSIHLFIGNSGGYREVFAESEAGAALKAFDLLKTYDILELDFDRNACLNEKIFLLTRQVEGFSVNKIEENENAKS